MHSLKMSGKKNVKKAKLVDCTSVVQVPVTFEQFKDFLCSRSYDIISEGRYRKHFIAGKDVGDMWAMSMQSSIAAVISKVKYVANIIKNTENLSCKNLRMICSEVTSSQLPPTSVFTEVGTCVITKSRSSICINLGGSAKNTSPCNGELLIHPSLFHFFVMVWFVHKIEHIIRNYTRWWLENRDGSQESIDMLCTEFTNDAELFHNLHKLFNHAVEHIEKSLTLYQVGLGS